MVVMAVVVIFSPAIMIVLLGYVLRVDVDRMQAKLDRNFGFVVRVVKMHVRIDLAEVSNQQDYAQPQYPGSVSYSSVHRHSYEYNAVHVNVNPNRQWQLIVQQSAGQLVPFTWARLMQIHLLS
jgi:hypothetical protein